MSFPKLLLLGGVALFVTIGVVALGKKISSKNKVAARVENVPQPALVQEPPTVKEIYTKAAAIKAAPVIPGDDFPNIDRIFQLFTTGPTKLPIVETVSYSSAVPWLKGRPAWLADYATHYATSRHFIARGLNGKPDYFSQKITPGSTFNVFRKDKQFHFYLLVDLSLCKMGFYYLDLDTKERVLLKTYRVGVGRAEPNSPSGSLTPLGIYALGSKIAIYNPGMTGLFHNQKVEMISVFGTRWIPFHEAIEGNQAFTKGFGIHGAPFVQDPKTLQLVENCAAIGRAESDGSLLLSTEEMEELFSIIITKPTFVVIVKDFHEARLPGIEVATPTR